MTFLECIERRKAFFIGSVIGSVITYGIMLFLELPVAPVTGKIVIGMAAGILLLAPAVEYFWQKSRK